MLGRGLIILRVGLLRWEVIVVVGGFVGEELVYVLQVANLEAQEPIDDRAVFKAGADDVGGGAGGGVRLSELGERDQLGEEGEVSLEAHVVKRV